MQGAQLDLVAVPAAPAGTPDCESREAGGATGSLTVPPAALVPPL